MNKLLVIFALLAIFLGAFFVRVWGLGNYALSSDELIHLNAARADSLTKVGLNVEQSEAHAPMYYFWLWGMERFGVGVSVLRGAMVLFGLLYVGLVFYLGWRLFSTVSGIFLSFISAFGLASVVLSQTLREYIILLSLLSILVLAFFAVVKKFSYKSYLFYFLVAFFALLTSYTSVFVLASFGAVMIIRVLAAKSSKKVLLFVVIGNLFLALLFLGMYIFAIRSWYTFRGTYIDFSFGSWLSGGRIVGGNAWFVFLGITKSIVSMFVYFSYPSLLVVIPLLALFCYGLLLSIRKHIFWVVVALFLALILNIIVASLGKYPFIAARHCVYLMPLILPVIGQGFDGFWKRVGPVLQKLLGKKYEMSAALGLIFLTLMSTVYLVKSDIHRKIQSTEFPIKNSEIGAARNFLKTNLVQGDGVFLDSVSYWYLFESNGQNKPTERIGTNLLKVEQNGIFYYVNLEGVYISRGETPKDLINSLASQISGENRMYFFVAGRLVSSDISTNGMLGDLFFERPFSPNPNQPCGRENIKAVSAIYRSEVLSEIIGSKLELGNLCRGILVYGVKGDDLKAYSFLLN